LLIETAAGRSRSAALESSSLLAVWRAMEAARRSRSVR